MNWVKKYKLLAIEAIQYNIQPYIELVSGAVHTGVEVRRMDSEMSGLVE